MRIRVASQTRNQLMCIKMKKTYIQPAVKTSASYSESPLLAGSVTGDNGTGYGGVDENGEKDPDANYDNIWDDSYNVRRNRNVFDDDEE